VSKYRREKLNINYHKDLKKGLSINANDIVITHIAEFNNNKRQIDIVHAVNKLKNEYKNFKVLLVGRGPNINFIKQQVKNYHLEKYIKVLGHRNDINNLLMITDIGLLISIREGLPRSVMEMMAMEIPVIVTKIRGN